MGERENTEDLCDPSVAARFESTAHTIGFINCTSGSGRSGNFGAIVQAAGCSE